MSQTRRSLIEIFATFFRGNSVTCRDFNVQMIGVEGREKTTLFGFED